MSRTVGWQGTGASHTPVRGSEPGSHVSGRPGWRESCAPVARPVAGTTGQEEMTVCGLGHKQWDRKSPGAPRGFPTLF